MKKRTLDEMISYFNQQVSQMDIDQKYKIALLGMITAIGYESRKQERKWETCFDCPLSRGCPKINGCTNDQAEQYAIEIPDDCPIERKTGQWIPCSERLPEEKDAGILKKLGTQKRSDIVIVTEDVNGERMTDFGCTHDGVWQWEMKYAFPDYKVIAWMSLPEPYREANDD